MAPSISPTPTHLAPNRCRYLMEWRPTLPKPWGKQNKNRTASSQSFFFTFALHQALNYDTRHSSGTVWLFWIKAFNAYAYFFQMWERNQIHKHAEEHKQYFSTLTACSLKCIKVNLWGNILTEASLNNYKEISPFWHSRRIRDQLSPHSLINL